MSDAVLTPETSERVVAPDAGKFEPAATPEPRQLAATLRRLFAGEGLAARIARGATASIGLNAMGAVLSFAVQILLAQTLAPEGYGIYVYALAWMNVALLLGRLEVDSIAIRFVGAYFGQRDWARLRGFLSRAKRVVTTASFGVATLAALAVWTFGDSLTPELAAAYWAACALVPLTAALMLHMSILQGFQLVARSLAPNLVVRPALFGVGVLVVAYLLGIELSPAGAILLNVGATAVALTMLARTERSVTPPEARMVAPVLESSLWNRTAITFLFTAAAQLVLSQQIDVLIVGSYLGTQEAGFYGAASQLAMLVGFGATAVVFVVLPMISDLHARGRQRELQRVVRLGGLAMTAVALPVFAGLVLLGRVFLSWYGPEFVVAYPVLLALSFSQIIGASCGILGGFLLTMTGHQNQGGLVMAGTAVVNLVLTVLLTPRLGAVGAAIATMFASLLKAVVLVFLVRSLVGVRVISFREAR